MSTVEEITAAIVRLTPEQAARRQDWLAECAERQWDEHIERDVVAGRLDYLAEKALADYHAGRARPL